MTLKQFFDETQTDLSMVASDIKDGRLLVLNHHPAPDCPLVMAVRMSMSIPIVWEEVIWEADWGRYLGQPMNIHIIVDGGMLSNFPLEIFISGEPQVTRLMGPMQDNPVLGILIDESLPVKLSKRGILVDIDFKAREFKSVQRFKCIIDTITGAHDKMVIEAFKHLVVRLPACGYSTTEFDINDEQSNGLVEAGKQAMGAYLDDSPSPRLIPPGIESIESEKIKKAVNRIAARLLGF